MEGRYRQYFEEMPSYLTVHDREFRIVEGNRKFREDFGDRIGELCYQVYKRRDEVCPDCPVNTTFEDGRSHASEQQLLRKDGEPTWALVQTTPLRDSDGQVTSVMEMHTDINEAKRLEDKLRRTQEEMAQLFEEVPCYISVQGHDLRIKHANRRFRETFGLAVGEYCYQVYKHRDEPCLVCPVRQTLEDGQPRHHEEVVTSAEGKKINVLSTTQPIFDREGNPKAAIEMSADITKIRELQSQLTSIGLLVGSISHGIKGLLTGLDGGIYLLETGFQKDDKQRIEKGWDMVQRNVGRIRTMVMDILYYAKDRDLSLTEISPAEMITDIQGDLRKKASDLDLDFEAHVAGDAGTFIADAMAIRAMLMNVIENSFDACRADRNKPSHFVHLRVRREAPYMVFEVEDNGIGMDREMREKVFSLFFSSKGIKGTGLGLFIANKIVDKHGGRIDVDSEPERGTRFMIRFPLEARPSMPPVEEG